MGLFERFNLRVLSCQALLLCELRVQHAGLRVPKLRRIKVIPIKELSAFRRQVCITAHLQLIAVVSDFLPLFDKGLGFFLRVQVLTDCALFHNLELHDARIQPRHVVLNLFSCVPYRDYVYRGALILLLAFTITVA